MKKFFSKPFAFAIVFGFLLAAWVTYISLDAFVIPRKIATVTPDETETSDTVETKDPFAGAVITEDSYKDDEISVKIITDRALDTDIYVADIVVTDPGYLKTAFADDTCGVHITELISSLGKRKNAIVAINGDYYGFRELGFVLRNGTLYRDSSSGYEALIINADGGFEYVAEDEGDAHAIAAQGARQIFSFGPALVKDGEMSVDENAKIDREYREWVSNPRTAIGYVEPGHYIFVVSDGRTERSKGLSLYQLGGYMKNLGCTEAYNLDGGGSSEMWFMGKVLNNPTGDGKTIGEREVSDVVYIGR